MIGKFFVTAVFSALYVYTVEMFPTGCRIAAMGFCSTCARGGSIVAPYLADAVLKLLFQTFRKMAIFTSFKINAGKKGQSISTIHYFCLHQPSDWVPLPVVTRDEGRTFARKHG